MIVLRPVTVLTPVSLFSSTTLTKVGSIVVLNLVPVNIILVVPLIDELVDILVMLGLSARVE